MMADEKPVHIEGYALVYDVTDIQGAWGNTEVERMVAKTPTVPLRVGVDGPVIGKAHLKADRLGLHVTADIIPTNFVQRGVDEGIPYGDLVHGYVPDFLRNQEAQFSVSSALDEVSIVPIPAEEAK